MTSRIVASSLMALVPLLASVAGATPRAPEVGHFTDLDRQSVRAQDAAAILLPDGNWENTDMMDEAPVDFGIGGLGRSANVDNDTAHYKRGRTMIIHVFINHSGGTWEAPERATAGAKADAAKQFYLDNAPSAANVHFDHENGSAYYLYTANLGYNIPQDGMSWSVVDDAVADIGFGDGDVDGSAVDDMTIWLQNWNGGWDNVIAVFQPADITGRAFASFGHAKVVQYTDDTSSVWRHEWGHSFGACDEYEDDGECNGGVDCGACQSAYLHTTINNGNCELIGCPSNVSCVMINNVASTCDYTLEHWGWEDDDDDGRLDIVKRPDVNGVMRDIYPLPQDTHWLWNSTANGWSFSGRNNSWAVVGVRSPSTADYDMILYGDNNHNHQLGGSAFGGSTVDFVTVDYHHTNLGDEFLEIKRWAGDPDDYRINFDGNTSTTYPDGVVRNYNWAAPWAARALDLPLFGGETVSITLDVTSGSLDLGMALFKSNGDTYYAGRPGALWFRDANGAGGTETWTYTVPEDDVYGLIIFSNTAATGTYSVKVGPSPATLSEEVPFVSSFPLRLFNYDPNASYWSFIGNRPTDPGNTTVRLFNNSTYQSELEISNTYNVGAPNNTDFIAVDYNHVSGAIDYPRVVRESGTSHRTEWEHDADIQTGYVNGVWAVGHVGKVWDMYLESGTNYFFREYHAGALDTGLYVFGSDDGDYYKPRSGFEGAANFRPAVDGGEWFNYQATANDWYGLYMIVNDQSSGPYSIWAGPDVVLADDVLQTRDDEVVFASSVLTQSNWTVVGARPAENNEVSVWLYGDDAYTITTLAVSDQNQGPGEVSFVVGDYNHTALGTVYPRFRRSIGVSDFDYELETQSESMRYLGDPICSEFVWPEGDVVETVDLHLPDGADVLITVTPLTGDLDLGVEIFDSNGLANYYAASGDGVNRSDFAGVGGEEAVGFTADGADWRGLVIWSNSGSGTYSVCIGDRTIVGVALADRPVEFAFAASPNPFRSSAVIEFSLPRQDRVELTVYDVTGRLVKQLLNEAMPAGNHAVNWDGRDRSGRSVATGVYLARIQTSQEAEIRKMIRVQ